MREQRRKLAHALLTNLDGKSRLAVELKIGLRDGKVYNNREIGEELGISAERVRKIINEAYDIMYDNAQVITEQLG